MQAHIVLAHPEAKSFNAHLSAITRHALSDAGWRTSLSDLYAMDFDRREGPHHYASRQDPVCACGNEFASHRKLLGP